MVGADDQTIRAAAFQFLAQHSDSGDLPLKFTVLRDEFFFHGEHVSLIAQQGIFKPRQLDYPISITTSPKRGGLAPYDDGITDDGLLRYRYQGSDPNSRDNVGLRSALHDRIPLVYFHGIRKGLYVATWPVYIVADHPADLSVMVSMADPRTFRPDLPLHTANEAEQRYYERITKQRIGQATFREVVMRAYRDQCAVCRFRIPEMLDAAHIVAFQDGGPNELRNGLSMCKIHHAAFDANVIGIDPSAHVHVREDVLAVVDGPMLRHGIQEMHGTKLHLPTRLQDRPAGELLEQRFEQFAST